MKNALVCLAVLLGACSTTTSDEAIVARAGDHYITAEEFELNYEFGHAHLRRGPDSKRQYLNFMLNEIILASEGKRIGLDTASSIANALATLREELLIERVFEDRVLSQIEVTDEDIRAEINRGAVRFRFKFLPARTRESANKLRDLYVSEGYDAALEAVRASFSEAALPTGSTESPPLTADELEPQVLAVLQGLPINEVSDPVWYQGYWYLFEVTQITRQPVAPADYQSKASSAEKVLYNRRALEGATSFVASLMEPRNLATKREGFAVLSAALWSWYSEETPSRNLLETIIKGALDTGYTRQLAANLDAPLVSFDNDLWTIRDFLEHFTPGRYQLRAREQPAFIGRLADIVALVVRDALLLDMAEQDQLGDHAGTKRNLELWERQWIFQHYRQWWQGAEPITDLQVKSYYQEKDSQMQGRLVPFDSLTNSERAKIRAQLRRERLSRRADSLAQDLDIYVDEAMLDSLALSPVDANATVHLFKSNSSKMPFPIADPNWLATVTR